MIRTRSRQEILLAHRHLPSDIDADNTITGYANLPSNEWGLVKRELFSTYELYTIFGIAGHNAGVGIFHACAEMCFIFAQKLPPSSM